MQGSAKQGQDQASETTLASVLARLDVALSTRAAESTLGTRATETTVAAIQTALTFLGTEATLALIKAKTDNLDISLSALATALENITVQSSALPTGAATESTLSARATEATLALVKAKTDNLDLALTALRDALKGAGNKDFTTLDTLIAARLNTLGQKTMANSTPVVLPSDQNVNAVISGAASAGNSTTTPLLGGGTFTGAFQEIKDYAGLCMTVIADVASAAGGLKLQWSGDGASVDREDSTDVLAGVGRAFNVSTRGRYFRIVYVNGASAQATFRLQVSFLSGAAGMITRPVNDSFLDSNFAQPVRAAVAGRRSATGTFLNVESLASSPAGSEEGLIVRAIPREAASFLAFYEAVVPAANKYMATLFNANAARKLVVQKIFAWNTQIAAVAGALSLQEVRRITARTVGTAVTPNPYDTGDTLSASITADHNSSAVTDGDLLWKIIRAFDEIQTAGGGSYALETLTAVHPLTLIYERKDGVRGITLRNGQGLTIKNLTAVAVGTMNYGILFTDEAA